MQNRITKRYLLEREKELDKLYPGFSYFWVGRLVMAVKRLPGENTQRLSHLMTPREMNFWIEGFLKAFDTFRLGI